ncbi:MAG: cytochrome C, partial [Gammaproteobacteria bacterium]|nr:cytochrome C [Gammaproteobacteria bacterium]
THFDAAYEKAQIELFRDNAKQHITAFIQQQENAYDGWKLIVARNYSGIETRAKLGYAGMEDAISFNSANAYQGLKAAWYSAPFAPLALPNVAGITDIMAVWNQQSRDPLGWDDDKKLLINGGGQWNGHIPMLFYKNLAAQVTLGFNNVDLRVSAHSERLLLNLPAPAYPFKVDVKLAKQGQILFAQNCAACHQDNNGRVYQQMGTHLGRAKIAGSITTLGAQSSFTGNCGPETKITLSGTVITPCAEYKGVSLKGKSNQSMSNPKQHDGYNALPLVGIWAQAPYLHNGSVPTLYHLLLPSSRPDQFIKSRLDYDQENVGFAWDPEQTGKKGEGYLYDTAASDIIGHQGHDQDIRLDGQTFKLDWEDDRAGLNALLEYLKTL